MKKNVPPHSMIIPIALLLFTTGGLFAQHNPGVIIPFSESPVPAKPDYSNLDNWVALPSKSDNADLLPKNKVGLEDKQTTALVDVFYIHPTTLTQDDRPEWNADVADEFINNRTADLPVKYQATAFNSTGKIYAPRYRQAHLRAFFNYEDGGKYALGIAYSDVKAAFEYYLDNYNNGRPFIIAAHSQGTVHASYLIREMIEGKPLADQLIVAYVVGIPIRDTTFKQLPICTQPDQTGCYVTWMTYARDYIPENYENWNKGCNIVNPLTWTCETGLVPETKNKGFVGKKFVLRKNTWDAEISQDMLWVGKPHMPLGKLLTMKNFHIADYNLFWLDVRKNAELRTKAYLEGRTQTTSAE